MKADAIRDLILRLIAAAQQEGGFTEAVAFQIEQQFRREHRGDTIYVKEIREDPPIHKIRQDYLSGAPVDQVAKGAGISRRTMYRLLKR
jgi:DNA invertase Pin-like site-specific DNA recombinase